MNKPENRHKYSIDNGHNPDVRACFQARLQKNVQ